MHPGPGCPVIRADGLTTPTGRTSTLQLSSFCIDALVGKERRGSERVSARLAYAIGFYMRDKGKDQPGWTHPEFFRGREAAGEELQEVELEIDDGLWHSFEEEARKQQVSVEKLATHAVFYYAAELDAGRATRRIVDSIKGDDAEPGKA